MFAVAGAWGRPRKRKERDNDDDDDGIVHPKKVQRKDYPRCVSFGPLDFLDGLDYNDEKQDIIAIATYPLDSNMRHCYLRNQLKQMLENSWDREHNVYRLPMENITIDVDGFLLLTTRFPGDRHVKDFRIEPTNVVLPPPLNTQVYTVRPMLPEDEAEARMMLNSIQRPDPVEPVEIRYDGSDEENEEENFESEEAKHQDIHDALNGMFRRVFDDSENVQPDEIYVARVIEHLAEEPLFRDNYFQSQPLDFSDQYVDGLDHTDVVMAGIYRAQLYGELLRILRGLMADKHSPAANRLPRACSEEMKIDLESSWSSEELRVAEAHEEQFLTDKICFHRLAAWVLLFTLQLATAYRLYRANPNPVHASAWSGMVQTVANNFADLVLEDFGWGERILVRVLWRDLINLAENTNRFIA